MQQAHKMSLKSAADRNNELEAQLRTTDDRCIELSTNIARLNAIKVRLFSGVPLYHS